MVKIFYTLAVVLTNNYTTHCKNNKKLVNRHQGWGKKTLKGRNFRH